MNKTAFTFEELSQVLARRWDRAPEEVYTHNQHIGGRGPVLFASVNGDMADVGRSVEVSITGNNGPHRYQIKEEPACRLCGEPATAFGLCDRCDDELACQEWLDTGLAAVRGVL